jgi:hypothetical protein
MSPFLAVIVVSFFHIIVSIVKLTAMLSTKSGDATGQAMEQALARRRLVVAVSGSGNFAAWGLLFG